MLMLSKSGSAEDLRGAGDISAAMHAAGGLEFVVVEGLDAEADAVEAGREPGFGFFGCDCFGVGFEGDFGSFERVGGAQSVENFGESSGVEKAWSAAAEVDGVD